jgi:hypothetical protein
MTPGDRDKPSLTVGRRLNESLRDFFASHLNPSGCKTKMFELLRFRLPQDWTVGESSSILASLFVISASSNHSVHPHQHIQRDRSASLLSG